MGLIEELEQYIGRSAEDVTTLKTAYDQKLGGLNEALASISRPMTGGALAMNRRNTNRRNVTRKNANANSNPNRKEEEKYRLSLLFSLVVLGSLSHLRGITPFIHSFMEVLTVYKSSAYDRLIVPFMSVMEKSFTFMGSTLLPKVKEGIFHKMLSTFNGDDFLTDPNRVVATMANLSKVYVFMVSFMAPLLKIVYTPSVKVIQYTELEPTIREILKVLNESYKGAKGFTYMAIPMNSILMTPDMGTKEPPKM
jgi:hypothetical protein